MQYRRRIRTITAWQLNVQDWDGCVAIAVWCGGDIVDLDDYLAMNDRGIIWLPGPHGLGDCAEDGDWVVQLEDGSHQVMTSAVFDLLFEPAEGQ